MNIYKKAKGVNKNAVATIIPNEYKDFLLNNKCIRHSMNKIQRKDHRIGTYEINEIHCLALTTNINMTDYLLDLRVNFEKRLPITI